MIRFKFIILFCMCFAHTFAQKHTNSSTPISQKNPKLVIGIVVDQMRFDFLYRYYDRLGENGFKKLIRKGVNCTNTNYNYLPTNTGPGHATIFTGAPPAISGIAGNDWLDKITREKVYCTEDTTVTCVGCDSDAGKMSPKNLKVTTISDQIKLSQGMRGKSIGIALKDRGSILPAGHSANAAYWLEGQKGHFITSSYYLKNLPDWVQKFNSQALCEKYINSSWNTLYPIETYLASDVDQALYENPLSGESNPVFPHKFSKGKKNNYDNIRTSPFGNDITALFALAAIEGEKLGQGKDIDFLSISFSSTDYIGHSFGPNSIETEDCYLRLDKNIEAILTFLDQQIGEDNYLLFLTADHGICDIPGYSQKNKLPGNVLSKKVIYEDLNNDLKSKFGVEKLILDYEDNQFYIDFDIMKSNNLTYESIYETIKVSLIKNEGIVQVIDLHHISDALLPQYFINQIKNGIHPKRSGDILMMLEPGWITAYTVGTSHGSLYQYDTHVPLIFFGNHLLPKEITQHIEITQIAPTIATMLHIQSPTGVISSPINGITKP